MIPPALVFPALILAFWDAWRLMVARLGSDVGDWQLAAMIALVAAATGWRLRRSRLHVVDAFPLCTILATYTVAAATGWALPQMAAAVAGLGWAGWSSVKRGALPAPMIGILLLMLPLFPSLEFYLAYPMRRICAGLTAMMLRLNGVEVTVKGIALDWDGTLLLFDAACSGLRMLWSALLLVSAIALAGRFSLLRYGSAIIVALVATILGNALRAASLFYVENGFTPTFAGPAAHETVGIAAFAILATGTAWLVAPREWRRA
ncbi:hypothetical protein ACFB49_29530 [Sphingomonas sp. DBB INV C78]|uniref:archaeosortase/exosortase family protein n=1 Tax=Sphingomonas sp. DBB INV C78 TaxID=3349434 RepID=UPI0036D43DAC